MAIVPGTSQPNTGASAAAVGIAPADVAVGTLLQAVVKSINPPDTAPDGWVVPDDGTTVGQFSAVNSTTVYFKVADESDAPGTEYEWTLDDFQGWAVVISTVEGANPTPRLVIANGGSAGNGVELNATAEEGEWVFYAAGIGSNGTAIPGPDGLTLPSGGLAAQGNCSCAWLYAGPLSAGDVSYMPVWNEFTFNGVQAVAIFLTEAGGPEPETATAQGELTGPASTLAGEASATPPTAAANAELAGPGSRLSAETSATQPTASSRAALRGPATAVAARAAASPPTANGRGVLRGPASTVAGEATISPPVASARADLAGPASALAGDAITAASVATGRAALVGPGSRVQGRGVASLGTSSARARLRGPASRVRGRATATGETVLVEGYLTLEVAAFPLTLEAAAFPIQLEAKEFPQ